MKLDEDLLFGWPVDCLGLAFDRCEVGGRGPGTDVAQFTLANFFSTTKKVDNRNPSNATVCFQFFLLFLKD